MKEQLKKDIQRIVTEFSEEVGLFGLTGLSKRLQDHIDTLPYTGEDAINELHENRPLYKDSGLWQLRSDDMEEVIQQQRVNETFIQFIERCVLEQRANDTNELYRKDQEDGKL